MSRQSTARDSILKIIKKAKKPINSTEIQEKCKLFNRATIYRTLNTLKDEKIIRLVEIGDGSFHYELTKDHHHHLICVKCKSIQKINLPKKEEERIIKMQDEFQQKTKFINLEHSLEFFGLCSNCKNI